MKKLALSLLLSYPLLVGAETLAPLAGAPAPQTHAELWSSYDPRKEPLDVEVLKEWEEEGVVLRVVRYRIGIFKGEKAMMAGVYGFRKGSEPLPALLQIHGGGQYASFRAVLTNAKRGYATLSIAWAGRLAAPGYQVNPDRVKLFWEGETDDPSYRVTTDWGALDAYHAPSRYGKDAFVSIPEGNEDWWLDPVESPRNNSWFLCTLAARRGLTFLQEQPEVDAYRLGVYGHSMGGKLTVATAGSDQRVLAAAPSCGGISDRYNQNPLHRQTVGDRPALQSVSCPIIFLSPANDFHGRIHDLIQTTYDLGEEDWRVTCSPHLNHRDDPESEVATQLWFDQYLKKQFVWPSTPQMIVQLATEAGSPSVTVMADPSHPIVSVDLFVNEQGIAGDSRREMKTHINQHWRYVSMTGNGPARKASIPVYSTDRPLWVYAHVTYELEDPVSAVGYYYGDYTARQFTVSSLLQAFSPAELKAAGVRPTLESRSRLIETFEGEWRKEWFSYQKPTWELRTHKVFHPRYAAPNGTTKLAFEVKSELPNGLVVGLDDFVSIVTLEGGDQWQSISLGKEAFLNLGGEGKLDWASHYELRFLGQDTLRPGRGVKTKPKTVGKAWNGLPPMFRNLRWE
ncbi:MAG: hypothetical protein AAGJ31_07065 [Verrucomicrobiota bacterium]